MAIKKFTMKDVDEEIMQIVQQQSGGQPATSGPPSILQSLMDRVRPPRNSADGNAENQTQ